MAEEETISITKDEAHHLFLLLDKAMQDKRFNFIFDIDLVRKLAKFTGDKAWIDRNSSFPWSDGTRDSRHKRTP